MKLATTKALLAGTATVAIVVASVWYGAEKGSSGAFIVAGLTLLFWLGYPCAVQIGAWRRQRRIARLSTKLDRSTATAARKTEKAQQAADLAKRWPRLRFLAIRAERRREHATTAVERAEGLSRTLRAMSE